jgi:hypothetical protein
MSAFTKNDSIVLPPKMKESKSAKFNAKIDAMSKQQGKVDAWSGHYSLSLLFYTYLLKKYKSHCMLYRGDGFVGFNFDFMNFQFSEKTNLDFVIHQLAECINKRKVQTIIIPVRLIFRYTTGQPPDGHANALIYKKKFNTIEHFEPHGKYVNNHKNAAREVDYAISLQIKKLNAKLTAENQVTLISASDVCPHILGIQMLEEKYTVSRRREETRMGLIESKEMGYCEAWSLFFMELSLCNPEISSRNLQEIMYAKFKEDNVLGNYFLDVIRGYTRMINAKVLKYMEILFNKPLTVTDINNFDPDEKNDIWFQLKKDITLLADTEMDLINNPHLSTVDYIRGLNNSIKNTQKARFAELLSKAKTPSSMSPSPRESKSLPLEPSLQYSTNPPIPPTPPPIPSSFTIVLPNPEIKGTNSAQFNAKINEMSKQTGFDEWSGDQTIFTIFYIYLLNKYQSHCLLYRGIGSVGFYFEFDAYYKYTENNSDQIISQLVKCILDGKEIIVIPVRIVFKDNDGNIENEHANVLIYNKKLKAIENFDPHGKDYKFNTKKKHNRIIVQEHNIHNAIYEQIVKIRARLPTETIIEYYSASATSPREEGFQKIAEKSKSQAGYSYAWSLFYIELALCNPGIRSSDLQKRIFEMYDKDAATVDNYFSNVIRGYTRMINEKIVKFLEILFEKKNIHVKEINRLIRGDMWDSLSFDISLLAEVELELQMNNFSADAYIRKLDTTTDNGFKKAKFANLLMKKSSPLRNLPQYPAFPANPVALPQYPAFPTNPVALPQYPAFPTNPTRTSSTRKSNSSSRSPQMPTQHAITRKSSPQMPIPPAIMQKSSPTGKTQKNVTLKNVSSVMFTSEIPTRMNKNR